MSRAIRFDVEDRDGGDKKTIGRVNGADWHLGLAVICKKDASIRLVDRHMRE